MTSLASFPVDLGTAVRVQCDAGYDVIICQGGTDYTYDSDPAVCKAAGEEVADFEGKYLVYYFFFFSYYFSINNMGGLGFY